MQEVLNKYSAHISTLVVLILYLVAYNPANGFFVLDDVAFLFESELTRRLERLLKLPWYSLVLERPFTRVYFHLATQFFGYTAEVYHTIGLVLHLVVSIQIGWLISLLLPGLKRKLLVPAASIFLLHPIQTQGVNYIVQIGLLWSALWLLLALIAYLNARRGKQWYWMIFGFSVALSILSKPTGILIAPLCVLMEWLVLTAAPYRRTLGASWVVLSAGLLVLGLLLPDGLVDGSAPSKWDYAMMQLAVLPRYIGQLLLAHPLSFDHPLFVNAPPQVWQQVLGALIVLILLALSWLLRKKSAVLSFSLLWVLICLIPESSILPLRDPMVEHRTYLAMGGLAFFIGAIAERLSSKEWMRYGFAGLILLLSVMTFIRNLDWSSEKDLWLAVAEKYPDSSRTQFHLAEIAFDQEQLAVALEHLNMALEKDPEHVPSLNSKASLLIGQGDLEGARSLALRAMSKEPKNTAAQLNLGVVEERLGKVTEAEQYYKNALRQCVFCAEPHLYLGTLYLTQGKLKPAERQLLESFKLRPSSRACQNLSETYKRMKNYDEARYWEERKQAFES